MRNRPPHVKVLEDDKALIDKTINDLRHNFYIKIEAEKIHISNKGKGRDMIPGQPEAVHYLLHYRSTEFGALGMAVYIEDLVQKAREAMSC